MSKKGEKEEITISGAKYTVGPDIDLDIEVVLDKQGNRLTNQRAKEIAQEILQEARSLDEPQIKERLARQKEATPIDFDDL
jgi:hypothetical protein